MEIIVSPTMQQARFYCEHEREPRCSVWDRQVKVVTPANPASLRGLRLGPEDKLTILPRASGLQTAEAWLDLIEQARLIEMTRQTT